MAQTIQILRTNTNTAPATLLPGALSVELGAQTKLWVGSGGGNRLLLSSDPADASASGSAFLKLAGGTMTGPIVLPGNPTLALQAAPKQYIDTTAATLVPLAGGTMLGPLVLAADPTANLGAATKQYVDTFPGHAVVAAAPPTATPGTLWFDSNAGQLYVRYDDSNSVQWVPAVNMAGSAIPLPLAVTSGGTGAITAPAALTNLGAVAKAGDTMTGLLTLSGPPTVALHAATKAYVDGFVAKAGDTMTGSLLLNSALANLYFGSAAAPAGAQTGQIINQVAGNISAVLTTSVGTGGAGVSTNLYRDASSWRYLGAGAASVWITSIDGSGVSLWGAPSGAAGAVATISEAFTLRNDGSMIIRGSGVTGLTFQPSTGWGIIYLKKSASGQTNAIIGYTGNSARWEMDIGNGAAETGGNAGSDFVLSRYNDAGSAIDSPFQIRRNSGQTNFTCATDDYCVTVSKTAAGGAAWMTITNDAIRQWTWGVSNAGSWVITDEGVGAARIIVNTSGGCSNLSGTWSAISDERTKRNISDYTQGLAALRELKPVTYQHNGKGGTEDSKTQHFGLVAQQVEPHMPELVGELAVNQPKDELDMIKTVDPGRAIYAVINALKEIDARLLKLEGAR